MDSQVIVTVGVQVFPFGKYHLDETVSFGVAAFTGQDIPEILPPVTAADQLVTSAPAQVF